MKTLVAALAVVLSLGAGSRGSDLSEKEDITRTLRFAGGESPNRLVVDNINGSIGIVGYDGSDVQLVAHRTSYGTSAARLKESKEKITLDIQEEPGGSSSTSIPPGAAATEHTAGGTTTVSTPILILRSKSRRDPIFR